MPQAIDIPLNVRKDPFLEKGTPIRSESGRA